MKAANNSIREFLLETNASTGNTLNVVSIRAEEFKRLECFHRTGNFGIYKRDNQNFTFNMKNDYWFRNEMNDLLNELQIIDYKEIERIWGPLIK